MSTVIFRYKTHLNIIRILTFTMNPSIYYFFVIFHPFEFGNIFSLPFRSKLRSQHFKTQCLTNSSLSNVETLSKTDIKYLNTVKRVQIQLNVNENDPLCKKEVMEKNMYNISDYYAPRL